MRGNTFQNTGLGAVFLLSSTQRTLPCLSPMVNGTVKHFQSIGDTYARWSVSYPGSYYAISSSGPNLLFANVTGMKADGGGIGRGSLNLTAFGRIAIANIQEVNVAVPLIGLQDQR